MAEGSGSFSQRVADLTTRVALLEAGIAANLESVRRLSVLVEGNGQTSGFGSRITNVEYTVIRIEAEITQLRGKLTDYIQSNIDDEKNEADRRNKRADSLYVAVIMLVISTVVSTVLFLLRLK